MSWDGNKANFRVFHFSNFEVQYLPEYLSKTLQIDSGYPQLPLNLTERFNH